MKQNILKGLLIDRMMIGLLMKVYNNTILTDNLMFILKGDHGYVEDGRDIFDDDLDSESIALAQKQQKRGKKRKKGLADTSTPKGNLHFFLANVQPKKKVNLILTFTLNSFKNI